MRSQIDIVIYISFVCYMFFQQILVFFSEFFISLGFYVIIFLDQGVVEFLKLLCFFYRNGQFLFRIQFEKVKIDEKF